MFDHFFNQDIDLINSLDKTLWNIIKDLKLFIQTKPLGQIHSSINSNVFIENPSLVYIGKNVTIEPYSYIKGPCVIEDDCVIRHGAYLRENVYLSKKVVIGHATEIKNSLVMKNSSVAHFAYVGDSLIGSKVNLGAGVRLANYKLDKSNISVFFQGKKYLTDLRKLGAIIGDNVQIGCNTVINPGTLIEKNAIIYPLVNASKHVIEKARIRR